MALRELYEADYKKVKEMRDRLTNATIKRIAGRPTSERLSLVTRKMIKKATEMPWILYVPPKLPPRKPGQPVKKCPNYVPTPKNELGFLLNKKQPTTESLLRETVKCIEQLNTTTTKPNVKHREEHRNATTTTKPKITQREMLKCIKRLNATTTNQNGLVSLKKQSKLRDNKLEKMRDKNERITKAVKLVKVTDSVGRTSWTVKEQRV